MNRIADTFTPRRQLFSRPHSTGSALLSYRTVPTIRPASYFRSSHNSKLTALCLVRALLQVGFDVDLVEASIDSAPRRRYDVFIGHGRCYSRIAEALNSGCRRYLLVTGAYPEFGNRAQRERAELLRLRKGVSIPPFADNYVDYMDDNLSRADAVLMLGNAWTRSTYPAAVQERIATFNNPTAFAIQRRTRRTNRHIFCSSVGQVHRGLDLVLEAFGDLPAHLSVVSPVLAEKEFCEAYRDELFGRSNIRTLGVMNTASARFRAVASSADFCILPSCSEGQSGSVVNLMALGVLPIVTRETGIECGEHGILIGAPTPQAVRCAVVRAAALPNAELLLRREIMARQISNHQPDAVTARLVEILRA